MTLFLTERPVGAPAAARLSEDTNVVSALRRRARTCACGRVQRAQTAPQRAGADAGVPACAQLPGDAEVVRAQLRIERRARLAPPALPSSFAADVAEITGAARAQRHARSHAVMPGASVAGMQTMVGAACADPGTVLAVACCSVAAWLADGLHSRLERPAPAAAAARPAGGASSACSYMDFERPVAACSRMVFVCCDRTSFYPAREPIPGARACAPAPRRNSADRLCCRARRLARHARHLHRMDLRPSLTEPPP